MQISRNVYEQKEQQKQILEIRFGFYFFALIIQLLKDLWSDVD